MVVESERLNASLYAVFVKGNMIVCIVIGRQYGTDSQNDSGYPSGITHMPGPAGFSGRP
jgi:hypothetical protein